MPEGSKPRLALPDQIVTDDISRAPVAQLDRVSGYEPKVGSSNLSGRANLHNVASHYAGDTPALVFATSRSYGVWPSKAPCGRW